MLKKLRKYLESEDKTIFDIIVYGSSLKGKMKVNDLDILIIFLEGNLRERLSKLQAMKNKLKNKLEIKLDIKQILLKELFTPEFFAKSGIFLEGFSLFRNKNFSEVLGFKPFSLFWYDLNKLNHNEKVKFNYILAGRNSKGLIKELNGKRLVKGAIKIPILNSLKFENVLRTNNVNYKKKNILEEI